MKRNLQQGFCLLWLVFIASAHSHPLKMSTSLIEYDAEQSKMSLECRVFIDDFANTLSRRSLNASNLTAEDIYAIENYFSQFYHVAHNGQKVSFKYRTSEVFGGDNVLSLNFVIENLTLQAGDQLLIENQLFFTRFGALQSNKMTVRIPPFITEEFFETKLNKFARLYRF